MAATFACATKVKGVVLFFRCDNDDLEILMPLAFSRIIAENKRHYVFYVSKFITFQSKKWFFCIITFYEISYTHFFL
jgi:hypothetical protein